MYQQVIEIASLEQSQLDYPGVSIRLIEKRDDGATVILTEMEPGSVIPEHWHTQADETVYVVSGDFIEAGEPHTPGTYFIGAAKTSHGPHSTVGGCTLLTHFSKELDFQLGPATL